MSYDSYPEPEILARLAQDEPVLTRPSARETPTLIEAVAFFALAAVFILAIPAIGAAVAIHWHLFGSISLQKLVLDPRFTIPMMIVSYAAVFLAAAVLFGRAWSRPFLEGIHWNFGQLKQHWIWLPILGMGLGATIQLASSYLPVPKELPVEAMFRNATDAWIIALFGVLIAPVAEEIAFRGFLFPALRRWTGGILAAILTSAPFVLVHAQQVAHAWGPLALIFVVSMVLVGVRDRLNSVAASALVHASYNLSIFIVIFYGSGGFMHLERLKN